jgi:invasion protein IalB
VTRQLLPGLIAAVCLWAGASAAIAQTAAGGAEPDAAGTPGAAGLPQAPEGISADEIANNTAFGDWVVFCEAVTIRRTVCQLVQELSLRDSDRMLARFVALPVEEGAVLVAQVPMGVYLPGGAVYRFAELDEEPQREMIWQRCFGDVCEAAIPLAEEELAVFARAQSMLFGFRMDAEEEPIILRVDVSRFAEAIGLLSEAQTDAVTE